jgi:hypothetical protein
VLIAQHLDLIVVALNACELAAADVFGTDTEAVFAVLGGFECVNDVVMVFPLA